MPDGCRTPTSGSRLPAGMSRRSSHQGLGLLIHPFFRQMPDFFHVRLHHLPPNTVAHLSSFVTLTEAFLGISLDWALLKHFFFYVKLQTMPKDVYDTCKAPGIQAKRMSSYFEMKCPDSLKGWTSTWFYFEELSTPICDVALPPYSSTPVVWHPFRGLKPTRGKAKQATVLAKQVAVLSATGLSGQDIMAAWVSQRIQPLKAHGRGMWYYTGGRDPSVPRRSDWRTPPLRPG